RRRGRRGSPACGARGRRRAAARRRSSRALSSPGQRVRSAGGGLTRTRLTLPRPAAIRLDVHICTPSPAAGYKAGPRALMHHRKEGCSMKRLHLWPGAAACLAVSLTLAFAAGAGASGTAAAATVRIATPRTAGTAIIYLTESFAKKRGLKFEYSSAFTF